MFSDKRGAELVLYKLKKDSPDRLRLFACYLSGESLYINMFQETYSATTLTLSADCGLKRSVYVRLPHDGHS